MNSWIKIGLICIGSGALGFCITFVMAMLSSKVLDDDWRWWR